LQLELGEGPQWSVAHSGEMLAIRDVATHDHGRWPVFATSLSELPVAALYCVPIRMGAVILGVATLHLESPPPLTDDQESTALALGFAIAPAVVNEAVRYLNADVPGDPTSTSALHREVHQATGVMLVQLNTTATLAYAHMQAYAFANGMTLHDVARAVISGDLTFTEALPEDPEERRHP